MLPLTAGLGYHFLPVATGLFGFRFVVVLILIFLVASGRGMLLDFGSLSRWFFRMGAFWICWGLFSVIWSSILFNSDVSSSLIEVLAVVFGFLAAAVLLNLVFRVANALEALRIGWVLAFVATSAVAVWELTSGAHLSGHQQTLESLTLGSIVFSTFGNPNNYAAFLCLCFPFLIWSFRAARGWWKVLYLLLVLGAFGLVILTTGRLGLLAMVLEFMVLVALTLSVRRALLVGAAVVVGVIASVGASGSFDDPSSFKLFRIYDELVIGGSASIRLNLLKDGMVFLRQSWGAGIGPANFEHLMLTGQGPYPTEGYVNPHNFWLEVASQYGLLVFVGFAGWMLFATTRIWRVRELAIKADDWPSGYAAEAIILGIVGYIFVAVENSSYIAQPENWMFLASVLAVTCFLSEDHPAFLGGRQ